MAVVTFYQTLGDTPAHVDAVLPQLLDKATSSGQRVALYCPTPARHIRLDETLWSHAPTAFLPHGMAGGPHDAQQPVLLCLPEKTPFPDRLPIILAGAEPALIDMLPTHAKILYMFDNSPIVTTRARELWATLKKNEHTLTYWKQTEKNGWEKIGG